MARLRHALPPPPALLAVFALACNAPPAAPPPGPQPPTSTTAVPGPTSPQVQTSSAPPAQSSGPTALASTAPSAATAPPPSASSGADAAPGGALAALVPALRDASGALLPQTEERPSATDPFFQAGVEALFAAIRDDEPDRALPFFFPKEAYEQVKAIARPGRDWETRLVRLFRRDVHDLHKKLGSRASEAQFRRVLLKEEKAQWMKPGTEGNRLGYFRLTRSVLQYADATGKEHDLRLTSLISWRGHWYLVHLSGFE